MSLILSKFHNHDLFRLYLQVENLFLIFQNNLSNKQVFELSHTSKVFEELPICWLGIHTNKMRVLFGGFKVNKFVL